MIPLAQTQDFKTVKDFVTMGMFSLMPPLVFIVMNDSQIVYIPDGATADPGSQWDEILFRKQHDSLDILNAKTGTVIGFIDDLGNIPDILSMSEHYVGWFPDEKTLVSRRIIPNMKDIFI